MAAPDFPASPTVGQTYTAPSGLVYTWDGAVWSNSGAPQSAYWSDTGTALRPTSAGRQVLIPGDTTNGASEYLGPTTGTARSRLVHHPTVNAESLLSINRDWVANNAQDDTTKPSWGIRLACDANDNVMIQRAAANAPGTQVSILECRGSDGKTYCTLANASVTGAMLQNNACLHSYTSAAVPNSWSTNATGSWVAIPNACSVTIAANCWILLLSNVALTYTGNSGSLTFYTGWMLNGTVMVAYRYNVSGGGAGSLWSFPLPVPSLWDSPRAAGSYTYQLCCYLAANNGVIAVQSDSTGTVTVVQFN